MLLLLEFLLNHCFIFLIFSSKPFEGEWNQVVDSSQLQLTIDSAKRPKFNENPDGNCTVETYTVLHSRNGPNKSIVIGRLEDGTRFLANTDQDQKTLEYMGMQDMLDAKGTVSSDGKRNIFKPNL